MIVSKFCDIWFINVNNIKFILRNPWDMGPNDEYVEEIDESKFSHRWDEVATEQDIKSVKNIVTKRCYNASLKRRILNAIENDKGGEPKVELQKIMITPREDHRKVFNAIMAHFNKEHIVTVKGAWVSGQYEITFNTQEASDELKSVCEKLNDWAADSGSMIRFFDYKITPIPQGVVARWYPCYWVDELDGMHGANNIKTLIEKCENGTFPYEVFAIYDVHDMKNPVWTHGEYLYIDPEEFQ